MKWEGQRDIFWVKDFKLASYNKGNPEKGEFGYDLRNVLTWMMQCACRKDQALVQPRIDALFVGIDLSSKARLVISFPRPKGSKDERGGWKKLVRVVDRVLRSSGLRKDDSDSDDNEWKNPYDPRDQQQSSTPNNYESVLYATSGSLGNLEPDFLLQMYEAMEGKEKRASKGTEWERIHDDVRCFWPSKVTACNMDLMGVVGALRPMPQSHWDTIPDRSKVKVFHDAIPNPPTKIPSKLMRSSGQEFHPVTHGKFIWNSRGVLYVGSHNFSKAAWGLCDAQPKNVEIGVVLATRVTDKCAEWISRFPCQLVSPDEESPVTYSPYTRYRDIEHDHPEAQDRVFRQAIRLYDLAATVWPPNHSFFDMPLETLLGRSMESVKVFVQEYQPKIHEAMEHKTRNESSESEDEAYRYDD
jgi:Tyrosyl-DNA phosphodiesterase